MILTTELKVNFCPTIERYLSAINCRYFQRLFGKERLKLLDFDTRQFFVHSCFSCHCHLGTRIQQHLKGYTNDWTRNHTYLPISWAVFLGSLDTVVLAEEILMHWLLPGVSCCLRFLVAPLSNHIPFPDSFHWRQPNALASVPTNITVGTAHVALFSWYFPFVLVAGWGWVVGGLVSMFFIVSVVVARYAKRLVNKDTWAVSSLIASRLACNSESTLACLVLSVSSPVSCYLNS